MKLIKVKCKDDRYASNGAELAKFLNQLLSENLVPGVKIKSSTGEVKNKFDVVIEAKTPASAKTFFGNVEKIIRGLGLPINNFNIRGQNNPTSATIEFNTEKLKEWYSK